jgi:hypothetical protein
VIAYGSSMTEQHGTATDPIAWRAIVYESPVLASDGRTAGTVREVLGSDADDIFHGIRLRLAGAHRDVMVDSDHVTSISKDHLTTDMSTDELTALPDYDEHADYHLTVVGHLLWKHLGWRRDSKSDEEAG